MLSVLGLLSLEIVTIHVRALVATVDFLIHRSTIQLSFTLLGISIDVTNLTLTARLLIESVKTVALPHALSVTSLRS